MSSRDVVFLLNLFWNIRRRRSQTSSLHVQTVGTSLNTFDAIWSIGTSTCLVSKQCLIALDLFGPANDPQVVPQMISQDRKIVLKIILHRKWSPRQKILKIPGLWNLDSGFKIYAIAFFCYCETQKTVNMWIRFQKVNFVLKQVQETREPQNHNL